MHCKGIANDVKEYEDIVYDPGGLNLHILMRYKTRILQLLNYFKSIFKAYKELSNRQGEATARRSGIVDRMYNSTKKVTAHELALEYNIDRSTVFRDVNKAIESLSIMLWGIDSFDDLERCN